MGTRGELLSLVDAAPNGLATLQAALTTWLDRDLAAVVDERGALGPGRPAGAEPAPRPPGTRLSVVDHPPDEGETLLDWYVVVAPPARWRAVGRGQIVVSDGHRSWVGTSTLVTERDSARALIHDAGAIGACLYPGPALLGLELGDPEPDEIDGRPCVVADARRPTAGMPPVPRDLVGIDHRCWFDAATGIVLRHEGYVDGERCSWTQLSDLVVDAPVDDEEFKPPPGAMVRSHHELLRDHLAELGIDPDTVDLDDPAQVREALRHRA
jgi:hypothetical protein